MLAAQPEVTRHDSAHERLQQHAALLEAWLTRRARIPSRWQDETFGRLVDLVRAQLRPVRECEVLSLSYGREHFHVMAVGRQPDPIVLLSRNATEVAYAVRWLELTHQVSFGPWLNVLTQDNGAYLEIR